jgi:hypothetical protein
MIAWRHAAAGVFFTESLRLSLVAGASNPCAALIHFILFVCPLRPSSCSQEKLDHSKAEPLPTGRRRGRPPRSCSARGLQHRRSCRTIDFDRTLTDSVHPLQHQTHFGRFELSDIAPCSVPHAASLAASEGSSRASLLIASPIHQGRPSPRPAPAPLAIEATSEG